MLNELGIYIHIPFCKQKCYYCDFVSYSNKCSEVKEYIGTLKAVSTSAIQRRFKIGYAKASRLIDKLEEDELISPYNGLSEPRKVL